MKRLTRVPRIVCANFWWKYSWWVYNFDFEIVTSEPAVNTQNVDWRQEFRARSIAEVMHLEDVASSVNESGDKADEPDTGKITLTILEALTE